MKTKGMLEAIKVLDLGVYGIGPIACSFLGSLGADVIRIEHPTAGKIRMTGIPFKLIGTPGEIKDPATDPEATY